MISTICDVCKTSVATYRLVKQVPPMNLYMAQQAALQNYTPPEPVDFCLDCLACYVSNMKAAAGNV